MLFKNVASQGIHVYAYDSTTGDPKTGDAANITAYISLDGTANAIDDPNPAEVDSTNMPGVYYFALAQAETNCNAFALYAKSATENIRLEPIIGFTTGAAATQTGDSYAVVAHTDYGNAKLVRSTTPANTLTVDANHLVAVPSTQKVDVETIKTQVLTCEAAVTILTNVGTVNPIDVTAGGCVGIDWANVEAPTTTVALTGTTIATTQKVDLETIKTQTITCAAGVTVLASVGTAATSTAQTGDTFAALKPANTWYVSKGGNDSNAGTTWNAAKLTVAATVAAASAGDTIIIGPGAYSEAVNAAAKAGMCFQGSGTGTQITSNNTTATLQIGDYTTVRNLRTTNTSTATSGAALYVYEKTGCRVEDCWIDGGYDGIQAYNSTGTLVARTRVKGKYDAVNLVAADRWDLLDCVFETDCTWNSGNGAYRAMVANNGSGMARHCTFSALRNDATDQDTSAVALGGDNNGGDYFLADCLFIAKQAGAGSGNVGGVCGANGFTYVGGTDGNVNVHGGTVIASNAGTGTTYSVYQATGTLAVCGLRYDRTATSGTITDLDDASVQTVIVTNNLDHLCKQATAAADMTTECVDGSILSRIMANGDTSAFDPSTDGLQPLRDRGDSAWVTATGFATPTNITSATGVQLAASQHVIVDSGTVTTLSNLPTGCATSANQDTLLNRIGAITGSGVNTILGFFKALLSKAATVPSDIGGTFDPTTDSIEAIRDTAPMGTAMRGTDSAATSAAMTTAQGTLTKLETMIAADGENYKLTADGLQEAPTGSGSGASAAEVWGNTTRTLTSTSSTTAPTVLTEAVDIYVSAFKGGTKRLCCRVRANNGDDITQAGITFIAYSIYRLDDDDPDSRTAITGHTAVAVTVASVISDTLQTDAYATSYNFDHTPVIATSAAFESIGDYLVEYTITPTTGQKIIVRFRVRVI